MGNAEPWTSPFLKDIFSDWCILKLSWVAGEQDYVFWGILKGVGLNGRNLSLF